jgi:Fe-S-cluster containining protein
MKECNHCGKCCRYLAISGPTQDMREYLIMRGIRYDKDQEMFLIPHKCQHLRHNKCTIYRTRPALCRDWNGERQIGDQKFYVPPECTLK